MSEYIDKQKLKDFYFWLPRKMQETFDYIIDSQPIADVVPRQELRDCRNELCQKCGRYSEAHTGACMSCRWQSV